MPVTGADPPVNVNVVVFMLAPFIGSLKFTDGASLVTGKLVEPLSGETLVTVGACAIRPEGITRRSDAAQNRNARPRAREAVPVRSCGDLSARESPGVFMVVVSPMISLF